MRGSARHQTHIDYMTKTWSSLCAAIFTMLCSCASTSIKHTWKSPDYHGGPVQKIAVLAVDERGLVRQGIENRVGNQIRNQGGDAIPTFKYLTLPEIKESKEKAGNRLMQEGADSIVIVCLVNKSSYESQLRTYPVAFVPGVPGYAGYGWYDFYSTIYTGMGINWSSSRDYLTLDASLFDLKTGARLWSCITESMLREDTDRLDVADAFAAKVAARMKEDGMIR